MYRILSMMSLAFVTGLAHAAPPEPGVYDAWLESRGGRVAFTVEVTRGSTGDPMVSIVNGDERIEVAAARVEDGALVVPFDPYNAWLRIVRDSDGTLSGEWTRRRAVNDYVSIAFAAEPQRPLPLVPPRELVLAERWSVRIGEDKESDVAVFRVMPDGRVRGTILTTTGDWRYLHGTFDGSTLELCSFAGSGATLLRAELSEDGEFLRGNVWSGGGVPRLFAGKADPDARLPGDMSITHARAKPAFDELAFVDPATDERVALSALIDGPAVIHVFGTWCPNSNDSAALMNELQERYASQGLSVVGLAFEGMKDATLDRACIESFRTRHQTRYPVLLAAGDSDKAEASKLLPFIDGLHAYPTAIFVDGAGRIRAVHTGFSGPATGAAHEEMKRRFFAAAESVLER